MSNRHFYSFMAKPTAPKVPSFADLDIVIALGNPGSEYTHTYHNAGALFIRFLSESFLQQAQDISLSRPKTVESLGTFMNVSGPAVQKFLKKDGIKPTQLLLVHDDVDVPIGEYKFSFGSGAAGHHGVESVIETLGTKDFWRLRIGIAKTIEALDGQFVKLKADTYVLRHISQADAELLQGAFVHATEQLEK